MFLNIIIKINKEVNETMMRIITGSAKGIRLKTLDGEITRPTAERVKEAVFSMLQFDIEGRSVLDLFAGSGQMALEALSRGAASATLIDKSADAVKIIEDNAKKCRFYDSCEIRRLDYLDYLKRNRGEKFDIVFLDPPYALHFYAPALRALLENDMLKPTSLIVCESGEDQIFDGDSGLANKFSVFKQSRYSRTFITILTPNTEETLND